MMSQVRAGTSVNSIYLQSSSAIEVSYDGHVHL